MTVRITRKSLFWFGALPLAFGGAAIAAAQDVPAQQPAQFSSGGVQEIIVTARRRDEASQDVPVVIAAVSQEDIARYNITTVSQVAKQVPGLMVGGNANTGAGVLNLRGIGSPSGSPATDQAVGIVVDGIFFSQANILRMGLRDLAGVQVLKGPQSLFFGKNSPAGVISIDTANPGDKFEASIRGGYEFANELKYAEGMISTPLTETLGIRVVGYYGESNGWFKNDAKPIPAVVVPASLGGTGESTLPGLGNDKVTSWPHRKELFVRGTLAFESGDGAFDAKLKIAYGRQRQLGGLGAGNQFHSCANGAPQWVLALGSAGSRDCKLDRNFNEPLVNPEIAKFDARLADGVQHVNSSQLLTSLSMNFQPSDTITISSTSGYYKLKEFATGTTWLGDLANLQSLENVSIDQWSQELRVLSSFDGPFNFLVGGYYQHIKNFHPGSSIWAPPASEVVGRKDVFVFINHTNTMKVEAYSVFGQAILDLSSQIQITAGGRYSWENKSIKAISQPYAFNPNTFEVAITPDEKSWKNFSPEVAIRYKPSPNTTFYGTYKKGFQSGGFDFGLGIISGGRTTLGDVSYDQVKVEGGEVGFKGILVDRQLSLDLALYHYKYQDLQVSAFDGETLTYRVTNAGTAVTKGVELSAQFEPRAVPGLQLRAAVNYGDQHYTSFENAPCFTGQTPAKGCAFRATAVDGKVMVRPILPGETGNAQDLSGRPLTRSSKWSGNIGATYEHEIGGGLSFSISGDGNYRSSYTPDPSQNPRALQKGYWLLNATAALRGPEDKWELALIGTNLTQKLRVTHSFANALTGGRTGSATAFEGDFLGSVTEPRTVTIQGTVRF